MDDEFEWVRNVRLMDMDNDGAPFWPRIEYDAGHLVETMDRVAADTIRFPSIGTGALFPTEHMPPHEDLGGRDLIRETVEALKPTGKRVVIYVPIGYFLPRRVARFHPEWLQRDLEGRPNGHPYLGAPGHEVGYRICTHGPYRQAIHNVVDQIVRDYPIDAMYFDGPHYQRACYCRWCVESFSAATGLDLPPIREVRTPSPTGTVFPTLDPDIDWEDPVIHAFFDWVAQMDIDLVGSLNKLIKGIRRIPLLVHGSSVMHRTFKPPFLEQIRQVEGCLFETGNDFLHRYTIAHLATSMDRAIWSYAGNWSWHPRVFEHGREFAVEAYSALAAGGTPFATWGNRLYFDSRRGAVVREVFEFLKARGRTLSGLKTVPYVAIPYSEHTGQWFGRDDPNGRYNNPYLSFVATLHDAHLQINPVLEDKLESVEALKPYAAVCLPQMACMSDSEAEVLRRYVAEGGGLVATGLCGTKDERGLDRPGFAIADVLGVDLLGQSGETFDRYLRVDAGHPVTSGFNPGELLPQLGRTVVEARKGAQVVATSVEHFQDAGPGLVVNTYGKGRVAYLASNLASMYADPQARPYRSSLFDRYPPLRRLLAQAVTWVAGRPCPFRVDALAALTATLAERPALRVLHLVNYAGPRFEEAHTVVEAFAPMVDVHAAVEVPAGQQVREVRAIVSGQPLPFEVQNGEAFFTVPKIAEYEAVLILLRSAQNSKQKRLGSATARDKRAL